MGSKKQNNYWHDLQKNPMDLPSTDGWVNCWVHTKEADYPIYLYYSKIDKQFLDNRRKNIFTLYTVLDLFGNQLYTDTAVNRTKDIIAWKYIESFEVK